MKFLQFASSEPSVSSSVRMNLTMSELRYRTAVPIFFRRDGKVLLCFLFLKLVRFFDKFLRLPAYFSFCNRQNCYFTQQKSVLTIIRLVTAVFSLKVAFHGNKNQIHNRHFPGSKCSRGCWNAASTRNVIFLVLEFLHPP